MSNPENWRHKLRVLERLGFTADARTRFPSRLYKSVAVLMAAPALAAPTMAPPPPFPVAPVVIEATGLDPATVRRDPLPFVMALASRIEHGERHDRLGRVELLKHWTRGDLRLTCGPAVDFVRRELATMGVRSFNVRLQARPPHNGVDDGHIMLEVETRRGPVLVDVGLKRLFLIDGQPASVEQIAARGFGAVEVGPPLAPFRVDDAFPHADRIRSVMSNPGPWYARMFSGTVWRAMDCDRNGCRGLSVVSDHGAASIRSHARSFSEVGRMSPARAASPISASATLSAFQNRTP